MTDDLAPTQQQTEEMELLNDILNTPSIAPSEDYTGDQFMSSYFDFDLTGPRGQGGEEGDLPMPARFLPSDLLDLENMMGSLNAVSDTGRS